MRKITLNLYAEGMTEEHVAQMADGMIQAIRNGSSGMRANGAGGFYEYSLEDSEQPETTNIMGTKKWAKTRKRPWEK